MCASARVSLLCACTKSRVLRARRPDRIMLKIDSNVGFSSLLTRHTFDACSERTAAPPMCFMRSCRAIVRTRLASGKLLTRHFGRKIDCRDSHPNSNASGLCHLIWCSDTAHSLPSPPRHCLDALLHAGKLVRAELKNCRNRRERSASRWVSERARDTCSLKRLIEIVHEIQQ